MSDLIVSYIRTGVPAFFGALSTWAVAKGFDFDFGVFIAPVTGFLTFLFYALVRWAEHHASWVGWLLGVRKTVNYTAPV